MRFLDLHPMITTPKIAEARDFYVRHFGFAALFEASWYVYLEAEADEDGRGAALSFIHPDHPSHPPGADLFDGRGVTLTLEVADAAAVYDALVASGAPITYPLTDEEWGQRRFMTIDPAGVQIDVVQQTEARPGYWEQFPPNP
jgi:uncharacterized glyoxalase superfamily protein PhnB